MQNDNSKFKIIRCLGVDWGEKRIGLALGDNETKLATPYKTVSGIEEIKKIVKEEKIDMVVAGKPLRMADTGCQISDVPAERDRMSDEFLDFLSKLKSQLDIPVETIDERLTSKAADALPGNKKEKAGRDEIAAMLILQNYLDKKQCESANKC
ncbi:MAG: Holliday junction resolvase RuvX [Patescibacteria group bacterium]|nr:Holliday junction resolvase RuvX [Patescibacteria group bacterium]